jgi:hypothetical protein
MLMRGLFIILILLPLQMAWSQSTDQIMQEIEEDTTLGTDIFSDFNEDLETAQVLEDERFYRYGRFFSVNLGAGLTTFTGNRGKAYQNNPPTFHLSVNYFMDFHNAVILGVEYSKHTMILDTVVNGFRSSGNLGAVSTDMTRVFVGYKYYIDTTDLGTAITYSNPHLIGRLEYWYQNNNYLDHPELKKNSGGGLGTGLGAGLEFPIELKKSYVSVEGLYHVVNFFDKYTQDYRQALDSSGNPIAGSTYGYQDLVGNVITLIVTYNFTW